MLPWDYWGISRELRPGVPVSVASAPGSICLRPSWPIRSPTESASAKPTARMRPFECRRSS